MVSSSSSALCAPPPPSKPPDPSAVVSLLPEPPIPPVPPEPPPVLLPLACVSHLAAGPPHSSPPSTAVLRTSTFLLLAAPLRLRPLSAAVHLSLPHRPPDLQPRYVCRSLMRGFLASLMPGASVLSALTICVAADENGFSGGDSFTFLIVCPASNKSRVRFLFSLFWASPTFLASVLLPLPQVCFALLSGGFGMDGCGLFENVLVLALDKLKSFLNLFAPIWYVLVYPTSISMPFFGIFTVSMRAFTAVCRLRLFIALTLINGSSCSKWQCVKKVSIGYCFSEYLVLSDLYSPFFSNLKVVKNEESSRSAAVLWMLLWLSLLAPAYLAFSSLIVFSARPICLSTSCLVWLLIASYIF